MITRHRNGFLFLIHLLMLTFLCLLILPSHPGRMYHWLDGSFMRYLTVEQHHAMSNFFYGMNLLEGLGDMSFPLLINLIPATWVDLFFQPGLPYSIAVYTIFSLQYFFAAYLLCHLFRFSKNIALTAAWLTTILVMPLLPSYHGSQLFYEITAISPYLINFIFFCTLFLCLFFYIGKVKFFNNIFMICAAFVTALYLLFANCVGIVIATPFFFFFCLAFLLTTESKLEFYAKVIFSIFSLFMLIGLNYFQYALGLFLYSIPVFFPSQLTTHFSLKSISMLFNTIYPAGIYIAGFGLMGIITTLFFGPNSLKKSAGIVLTFILLLLCFGAAILIFPNWYHGPDPLYFEYLLWPIYMAFAITFFTHCFNLLRRFLIKSRLFSSPSISHYSNQGTAQISPKISLFLFILAGMTVLLDLVYLPNEPQVRFPYPPTNPPRIVQHLIENASLSPNGLFKGYTATFYPKVEANHFTDWYTQITFDSLVLLPKLNYTYRMVGLWFYNIPTLNKYSPISSPALFSLIHHTLSRPIDQDIRNVYLLTQINIPLLQALGVRFLITNDKIDFPNTKLITTEAINKENGSLFLYEILHTNLASFSPTNFPILQNSNALKALINAHHVNFSTTAYVNKPVSYKVGKLENTTLSQIKDGVHLIANAKGTASLLLPVLYSHCLKFQFNDKKPEIFTVQRANIAETLIIFSKHLDVNIIYRYGLMQYSHCRLEDRKELKNIIAG